MKKLGYVLFIPVFLILLWVNFQIFLSLGANGFFFHVHSPVGIESISADKVNLDFNRTSRIDMEATVTCEIHCERQVINIPVLHTYFEKGETQFYKAYPLPSTAEGMCYYECIASYSPFGKYGATLVHPFYTERFRIEEK